MASGSDGGVIVGPAESSGAGELGDGGSTGAWSASARDVAVPEAFVRGVLGRDRASGQAWLDALPGRVERLCRRWGLRLDGSPRHGYLALVLPVRRGEEPFALKVSQPHDALQDEHRALTAWRGRGAARLAEADPAEGALLLEWLDPERSLATVPTDEALAVAGRLLRRLAIPAPSGVRTMDEESEDLRRRIPQRWADLGQPFPRRTLDRVMRTIEEMAASPDRLLVHFDLHDNNVLAGSREPWLAIDPKVVAGAPEYGVAQLLWRRGDELEGAPDLDRRISLLAEAAALDPDRTRSWSLVRIVDYWLWALGVGLTEDPRMCSRLVGWMEGPR